MAVDGKPDRPQEAILETQVGEPIFLGVLACAVSVWFSAPTDDTVRFALARIIAGVHYFSSLEELTQVRYARDASREGEDAIKLTVAFHASTLWMGREVVSFGI
jgi:hypothetical protein